MSLTLSSSGLTFSDSTSLTTKLPTVLNSTTVSSNTTQITGIPSNANIVWVNIAGLRNATATSKLYLKFINQSGSSVGSPALYRNSCISFGTGITESSGVLTTTGGNIFPLLPSTVLDYEWHGNIQMINNSGYWTITWRLSSIVTAGTAYRTTIGAGYGWMPTGTTLGGILLGLETSSDTLYGLWSVSYA